MIMFSMVGWEFEGWFLVLLSLRERRAKSIYAAGLM
jgi:hypothetical protein